MKKTEIMNRISGTIAKAKFSIVKHSPEILLSVGIVGAIATTIMACRATTQLDKILDESKENIDKIHECSQNDKYKDKYSSDDVKKDLAITYANAGLEIAKLYAPAVALGTLSVVSILSSHNILRKRNVALSAACAKVTKDFKKYRSRVVERFGEKVDRELKYNIKAKQFDETVVDENGKEKTVTKTAEVADIDELSSYARFFDESSPAWEKNAEYNLMFLRAQQQYANDLLRSRGHLFLNEVYDMLGLERSKAGQVVGWIYNPDQPTGDNYVDFGIYDVNREKARDFVNGYERAILLDFNVDGSILNAMD